jgi:hypothetical protein
VNRREWDNEFTQPIATRREDASHAEFTPAKLEAIRLRGRRRGKTALQSQRPANSIDL